MKQMQWCLFHQQSIDSKNLQQELQIQVIYQSSNLNNYQGIIFLFDMLNKDTFQFLEEFLNSKANNSILLGINNYTVYSQQYIIASDIIQLSKNIKIPVIFLESSNFGLVVAEMNKIDLCINQCLQSGKILQNQQITQSSVNQLQSKNIFTKSINDTRNLTLSLNQAYHNTVPLIIKILHHNQMIIRFYLFDSPEKIANQVSQSFGLNQQQNIHLCRQITQYAIQYGYITENIDRKLTQQNNNEMIFHFGLRKLKVIIKKRNSLDKYVQQIMNYFGLQDNIGYESIIMDQVQQFVE